MINKVLIANRGEIAVRIIRACHEMGIATVAIHSVADKESLHSIMADETVCVGGANSSDSYLNISNILNAAALHKVDAIHPGFGFLSENANFAQMVSDCGIKFIGPKPKCIALLGDKAQAKQTMKDAGVPTIPGSDGAVPDYNTAVELAQEIGYPLLIKASAGGGGRGIKRVDDASQLQDAYNSAKQEAKAYFGDDSVYMEKLLINTSHIEFQILADNSGNVVHLGERDCSMQRRNQKILEESPSVKLSPELRAEMGEVSLKAAKAAKYSNAGTIEFLLDEDKKFYFMEMNTRIQVEHPVTEMVTGIDLISEQIRIADDKKIEYSQNDIVFNGSSIECRINAEIPEKNFMPSGGTVEYLHVPSGYGVRFDSHLYQGYKLPMNYDSMIGKLIVWGKNRNEAIRRMKSALSEIIIEGVQCNIEFLLKLLDTKEFKDGSYNTSFLGEFLNGK